MQTATLHLTEFKTLGVTCLAGFDDASGEWTFVLRKESPTVFMLCYCPTSAADQQLRSFLSADQSMDGELVKAVLASLKPTEIERGKRNQARRSRKAT